MQNKINDKVVIITGASSGIGKAIAIELAKCGARVVLGARNDEKLQEVCQMIIRAGGKAVWRRTDVKIKEDLNQLVEFAMETYQRLDVLVNNAGLADVSRIDELRVDEWDNMIDINLKGVLNGMSAVLPVFKRQQEGHIVNIISTSGIKIVPTQGVYAGTKNAVRTISEAFRQESDGKIRITGISPGMVRTNLIDEIADTDMKATLSRIAIQPEAIAHAVIYAISQPKEVEVGDIVIRPAVQN